MRRINDRRLPAYALLLGCITLLAGWPLVAQEDPITADPQQPILGLVWSEKAPRTLVITEVAKGSAAAAARLAPGDIILAVNGKRVASGAELEKLLTDLRGGEKAMLLVARDRKQIKVEIAAPPVGATAARVGFLGANLQVDKKGRIVVNDVTSATPAADAGIVPGDIIIAVDGDIPKSVEELVDHATKIVDVKKPGDKIFVVVNRDGDEQKLAVVLPESSVPQPMPGQTGGTTVRDDRRDNRDAAVLGVIVAEGSIRVFITQVLAGGPAAKAGLVPADAILGVNGQKITSFAELDLATRGFKPGDKVAVDIQRSDKVFVATTIAMALKGSTRDVTLDASKSATSTTDGDVDVTVAGGHVSDARLQALERQVDTLTTLVERLAEDVADLKARP